MSALDRLLAVSDKRPPAADVLTAILADRYYLARTAQGEPFAVSAASPCVMIRFRGPGGLRQRLAADMWRLTGRAASSNALADVLAMAEGVASGTPAAAPALRVATVRGALFLDLGRPDGAAVMITPGRWEVVTRPPVLFARTAMTAEIPLPSRSGSGEAEARSLVNVRGDAAWTLVLACRIASLIPGITHPVELVTGPAGSAKTSATRILSDWIDPAPAMIPVPRDGRSWAAMAASRYVLPVDNVSSVPAWWSDLLCKAASGDGWVDRALYTDGDVYVAAFQSAVILNGITLGAFRGDLADRTAWHQLVPPAAYRSDDEITARWRAAWPSALAWLLDEAAAVHAAMAAAPPPSGGDRLARFSQVISLCDARRGTAALGAWRGGRAEMLEDVADGDLVAVALRAAVRSPWSGTPTELLALLKMSGGLEDGRFPWSPRVLSEHVERSAAALSSLGWQTWRHREGGTGARKWAVIPPGWVHDGQAWVRREAQANGHGLGPGIPAVTGIRDPDSAVR